MNRPRLYEKRYSISLTPSNVFCNYTGDFVQNELVEEFVISVGRQGVHFCLEEAPDSQEKSESRVEIKTDEPGKTIGWPANLNVTSSPYASASTILMIFLHPAILRPTFALVFRNCPQRW